MSQGGAWALAGLKRLAVGGAALLGVLSFLIVTPVVALVQPGFSLTLNSGEVADAFEVPLAFLMNPANHRRHALRDAGGASREWYSMPYQDGDDERFVWGATAGMLRNLYRFLIA